MRGCLFRMRGSLLRRLQPVSGFPPALIIDHLEGRRRGQYDVSEPTGVLTHHLVQDARSYVFMTKLAVTVSEHPAASWLDGRDVFHLRVSRNPR